MSYLPMDEGTKERVRALARRAAKPENHYRPGEAAVPGDSPTFREEVGSYKVVFTITVGSDGKKFRHMSMSNLSHAGLPNPVSVWTVAHWLGFTGATENAHGIVMEPPKGRWPLVQSSVDNCIIVGEPLAASPGESPRGEGG